MYRNSPLPVISLVSNTDLVEMLVLPVSKTKYTILEILKHVTSLFPLHQKHIKINPSLQNLGKKA